MLAASEADDHARNFFDGKVVVVTGAAGSVGSELLRQLLPLGVRQIRALDNDEDGVFRLSSRYRQDNRVIPLYCDVAKSERVLRNLADVDYLFHAAALKHVPVCEAAPTAAVDVNVLGVTNVVEAALVMGVQRVLFTSTDKAVNPTNVMGASKLLGERIAVAANMRNGHTIISCTRFGNVAGSRGSVLPLFKDQIARGGPLTLTSPEMSRFFMTLDQAVRMIIMSMIFATGGDTFVTKMECIRIVDLAETMLDLLRPKYGHVNMEIIGPRAGEKIFEELTSEEEQARTFDIAEYLIIQPSSSRHSLGETLEYNGLGRGLKIEKPYNSRTEAYLSHAEIAAFLAEHDLV